MKKAFTIAAGGALAAFSFSTSAAAQTGSGPAGMTAEEHQRMMTGSGTSIYGQMMSDPDMHRRMMAMMKRCEEMMSKMGKHSSASAETTTKKASADGQWGWRPDPRQAPGPRAALRPPIRVWVPAETSANQ